MVVFCRRCGRRLKGAKTARKEIGKCCERKEKEELLDEVQAAGYDGQIGRLGVQLLLQLETEGKA